MQNPNDIISSVGSGN